MIAFIAGLVFLIALVVGITGLVVHFAPLYYPAPRGLLIFLWVVPFAPLAMILSFIALVLATARGA